MSRQSTNSDYCHESHSHFFFSLYFTAGTEITFALHGSARPSTAGSNAASQRHAHADSNAASQGHAHADSTFTPCRSPTASIGEHVRGVAASPAELALPAGIAGQGSSSETVETEPRSAAPGSLALFKDESTGSTRSIGPGSMESLVDEHHTATHRTELPPLAESVANLSPTQGDGQGQSPGDSQGGFQRATGQGPQARSVVSCFMSCFSAPV